MNMNILKHSLINKVCAILTILALTISNFMFVGNAAVSYAIEIAKTNSSNVNFSTYFLDANGEKVDALEEDINKNDQYLYVDISVKNEGYFNGIIKLENNNFNLKPEVLSPEISKITENVVTLNQINAGTTATIKLGIEAIKDNTITETTLSTVTDVILEGQYVNSKNVEKDKYIDIKGKAKAQISWKSSSETKAILSSKILTNSVYEIDGAKKRIVQLLVSSKITNNNYPVKNTEITVSSLENVQEVTVHARTTSATNGALNLDAQNYTYNQKENKITIKLGNENKNQISWNKNAEDTLIITYVLDSGAQVLNKDITVNSKINTYDNKELTETNNVHIEKEIDGIVSYSLKNEEQAIYKGKIYTGEERDYITEYNLNIDYLNIANDITLKTSNPVYLSKDQEISANIKVKQTKINKKEFMKIFGEEGYITIKNEAGLVIANITKSSETDENGDIVVNYSGEVKNIEILTSKPIELGTLTIKNTKTILSSGYSKEAINELTEIKEEVSGTYNKKQLENQKATIKLNNTTSKASFEVNADKLSTMENNENVKMTVVLENNDESKDLYQNPQIRIKLPSQVTKVSAKCKLLYGNGLELSKAQVIKENENNVIAIDLAGTQSKYNAEAVEGTTIVIYANLELNKLAPSSNEKITLNYTNEIASSFEDNGYKEVPVSIDGSTGLITTNNIKEYQVETIGNQGTKNVNLDVSAEAKNATVSINTINNEGSAIKDVKILGSFPTGAEDNLKLALTSGINLTSNTKNVKVYYSDKEDATDDLQDASNGWTSKGDASSSKSYLITIDSLDMGESFDANYNLSIPGNLVYNMKAEEGYSVTYTNDLTANKKTMEATKLNLTTGGGPEITSNLKAYVGGKELADGAKVNSGEIIKYVVSVENTGNAPAENVNIEAIVPENTTYVKYVKDVLQASEEENVEPEEGDSSLGGIVDSDDEDEEIDPDEVFSDEDEEEIDEYETGEDQEEFDGEENKDVVEGNSSSEAGGEEDSDDDLAGSGVDDKYEEESPKDNKITSKIENLKVGGKQTFYFEVRVNDNVNSDIVENIKISYNEINQDKQITLKANSAELKATILMMDRTDLILKNHQEYIYLLKIDNLTESNLSNVEVKVNGNFTVKEAEIYDGEAEIIEVNDNTFTIKEIPANNSIEYMLYTYSATSENKQYTISALINGKYNTNQIIEEVEEEKITMSMTSDNEGDSVNAGDEITYNVTIKNDGDSDVNDLQIEQQLSSILNITSITANGNNVQYSKQSGGEDIENSYTIYFDEPLTKQEPLNVIVKARTDENMYVSENQQISSISKAYGEVLLAKSEQVNHVLLATPEDVENPNITDGGKIIERENNKPSQGEDKNPEDNDDDNDPSTGNENQEGNNTPNTENKKEPTYTISGTAWFDKNENGQRESDEETLSGIKVTLLDLQNNSAAEATTSENGFYSLTNVPNGQYVAIFEYDTEKYILTTYRADGISESRNSDVENVTMNLNGSEQKVASTDTLEVNSNSITNIDIGLVEAKTFDMELTKTISKVTITNAQGTEKHDYNDAKLAKVEVKAKDLSGTTVVVEYKIKVTNNGEIAGYAKNIVDYKPTDLSFNSSLNPDWYQSGDYLYSAALANTKLEAGESKDLTLVLTKTMTESNTGLVNNTAEISEDYNSLNAKDVDSTPGNRQNSEDDMGSSDLIISVKTGAAVSYIALTLSIIVVIAIAFYIIGKKVLKDSIKL